MNYQQIQDFLALRKIGSFNIGVERTLENDGYNIFCQKCEVFLADNPIQTQLEKAIEKLEDDISESKFWRSERGKKEEQRDFWMRGD